MPLPSTLYHYTSPAGFLGIMATRKLWASSIRHMNDATEYRYAHNVFEEAMSTAAQAVRRTALYVSVVAKGMVDDIREGVRELPQVLASSQGHNFVVSLSERHDQLSQWRA